jgi:hypothetical protein
MEQTEVTTHSFIVKIWVEETLDEEGRTLWRGHITHVSDGLRRYLQNLEDISGFIEPYLQGMGVKQADRSWLSRLRRVTRIRRCP